MWNPQAAKRTAKFLQAPNEFLLIIPHVLHSDMARGCPGFS
jgi:hypothetical protein